MSLLDEFAQPLAPLARQAHVDLAQARQSIAAHSAIDAEFDAAISNLVRTGYVRNRHVGTSVPFIALGLIWGDPNTLEKSWQGTALEDIFDYFHRVRGFPPSDAMRHAKLLAGSWLRTRVDQSRYALRGYKGDDEAARVYFVTPDDRQPTSSE